MLLKSNISSSFTELTFSHHFTGANIRLPDLRQVFPVSITLGQTHQDTHRGAALRMPLLPTPICAERTPQKPHSCTPQRGWWGCSCCCHWGSSEGSRGGWWCSCAARAGRTHRISRGLKGLELHSHTLTQFIMSGFCQASHHWVLSSRQNDNIVMLWLFNPMPKNAFIWFKLMCQMMDCLVSNARLDKMFLRQGPLVFLWASRIEMQNMWTWISDKSNM